MKKLTIVIPALNEESGIGKVIDGIPKKELHDLGYQVEVLVIDNDSEDGTARIAKNHGAVVVVETKRGYGNAYKAGFAHAKGDIIATGDADMTYPFSILPVALQKMERENVDFLNTNRMSSLKPEVMSFSHKIGNVLLTFLIRTLFRWPFKDSQSGMWIFKRSIWKKMRIRSSGMSFSQELKIEAYMRGFRCDEMDIRYESRVGERKINTYRDGIGNLINILYKRVTVPLRVRARS